MNFNWWTSVPERVVDSDDALNHRLGDLSCLLPLVMCIALACHIKYARGVKR